MAELVPNICPLAPAEDIGGGASSGSDTSGAAGRSAGLKWTYSTTTTASDPGAGFLRFNNATLSSATALYISETDGDANAMAAYLATWDDSSSAIRGTLTIRKDADASVFYVFSITGTLTDNGSWDTFTVAYVAGAGTLADNDIVDIEFSRAGDMGPSRYIRGASWDNGATPIAAADCSEVNIRCHLAGTISKWTVYTEGGTGSCQIDVRKRAYSSGMPGSGNSIVGTDPPKITGSDRAQNAGPLSNWSNTAAAANDLLTFVVTSTSGVFTAITVEVEIAVP